MQKCKCEHWQTCPTCYPKGFDTDGNRLPPEKTPLQDAREEVAMLREQLAELGKELSALRVKAVIADMPMSEVEARLKVRVSELEAVIKSHGIPVKTYSGGVAHYCTGEEK